MDQTRIRNFAIIAHIDHGKTTLTDRLLQLTNTVPERELSDRLLDSNPIEQERGVTIKLAPVTMSYELRGKNYELNLIDTPGHVDFSYEVERSLAACEAAVLLIDASQGVQAQTLAHAYKAVELGIDLIPVMNKIDLETADVDSTYIELEATFGFKKNEVSKISAKTGAGVERLLERIVNDVSKPGGDFNAEFRGLVFNSVYDSHLGMIAFIRVVDGVLLQGDKPYLVQAKKLIEMKELGIFSPERKRTKRLGAGEVGYVATGLKDIKDLRVGDTLTVLTKERGITQVIPLPGYKSPRHTVYADFYPAETTTFQELQSGLEKLKLADSSLITKSVHSPVLGNGFRLGFLGVFHVEITQERLSREQGVEVILTNPTVEYVVMLTDGSKMSVQTPSQLPDPARIKEILEPVALVMVITPKDYVGSVMELLQARRGDYKDTVYMGERAQIRYFIPLVELISGLFDQLKSVSQGFATLDYELVKPKRVDAVKLSILLNHEDVVPLSRIVVRSQSEVVGRKLVGEIKELLPRHAFAVPIQAVVGGSVVARETKPAFRKNVTEKLYGGDQSRKDKLLKKQKKGKKRLARFGRVSVPDDVLTKLATL